MELVDNNQTICDRCGTRYNWKEQDPPVGATIHWVPHCPDCGAKMTANPTSKSWLHIVSDGLDATDDNYEERVEDLNAHARLFHGRVVDLSSDELVELAQWFDRRAKSGKAYGPRFYRPVAFSLRQQAREKTV